MIASFVSSQKRHKDDQKSVRTSTFMLPVSPRCRVQPGINLHKNFFVVQYLIKQTKFIFLCQPIYTGFVTSKLQITGEVTRLYPSHYYFFKTGTLIR